MTEIVANSVLPAASRLLTLRTEDGLDLIARIDAPLDTAPVATLLCLHPLTTHGGMMDSHLLRKAAWRLPALAGIAVVRFNFRGATSSDGTSGGAYDEGVGEALDLRAALLAVRSAGLPDPWLLGWSFGTEVLIQHGDVDPVRGGILLSPPLRSTTDAQLAAWSRPLTVLVPELDDYLRPDEARRRFAVLPQADVIAVDGAKHLWVGERYVRIVLDRVVRVLAPDRAPLPTTYDGPVLRWDDLRGGATAATAGGAS